MRLGLFVLCGRWNVTKQPPLPLLELLVELLGEHDGSADGRLRSRWKRQLVGPLLYGYLGLRRLVVQRTSLLDAAQAKLLCLLEQLTTGM